MLELAFVIVYSAIAMWLTHLPRGHLVRTRARDGRLPVVAHESHRARPTKRAP